jgi:kinesin family protein 15
LLQADAFDLLGLPMIENALAGFNTSLVCYGQVLLIQGVGLLFYASPFCFLMLVHGLLNPSKSGTGKTYTMWGPLGAMVDSGSDHADLGVVPRVFQDLFSRIQRVSNFFTPPLLFVIASDPC